MKALVEEIAKALVEGQPEFPSLLFSFLLSSQRVVLQLFGRREIGCTSRTECRAQS